MPTISASQSCDPRGPDPTYAATEFYTHLKAVPGWPEMDLTVAAQAVQNSGHPRAYARWGPLATRIVAALSAQTCLDDVSLVGSPTAAAATAIAYARAQLGLPYEWAGNGPHLTELRSGKMLRTGGFDCSGLTKAAYAAAGIDLPRTAQTQYNAGPRLDHQMSPQPGDLVFFGTGPAHITWASWWPPATSSMHPIPGLWFAWNGSGLTSWVSHVRPPTCPMCRFPKEALPA
jgi:cell wall-associated NlpC family hydrolase